MRNFTIFSLACLSLHACADDAIEPQYLDAPEFQRSGATTILRLPQELREVSALERADERTVACLEDETGALYFVRIDGPQPIERVPFGQRGDYEGLARVDDEWFVLRSGGTLLQLIQAKHRFHVAQEFPLASTHTEFESLTFDTERRLLLTIAKDRSRAEGDSAQDRPVYAFDVDEYSWLAEPIAVLSRKMIRGTAHRLELDLPTRKTKKGSTKVKFDFGPSAMAIDAQSGLAWIVSGPDRTVLAFDASWNLVGTRVLDAGEAPQPEGIIELAPDRLVVATESTGAGGRLLIFDAGFQTPRSPQSGERPGHR